MRLLVFTLFLAAILLRPCLPLMAQSVGHVVITGIQTGDTASVNNEYIQLFNASSQAVDVTGWKLQYHSATGTTWQAKFTFACAGSANCAVTIPAQEHVTLASYDRADTTYSISHFMADSGAVRLVMADNATVVDLVGFGKANTYEGTGPAGAMHDGLFMRQADSDGQPIDTDDNAHDFQTADGQQAVTPVSQPPVVAAMPFAKLLITELLPDPSSPATDAEDEFIEIYNPTTDAVNLKGYVLQAGTDWKYAYTLPDMVIAPDTYMAFYSRQTKVTLINSGTAVRLVDPAGVISDEVVSYGAAKSGQSWALSSNATWAWTTTPTPAQPNTLSQPESKATTTSAPKTTTKKAAKTTATKTTKPKATKVPALPKGDNAKQSNVEPPTVATAPGLNYWLVGGSASAVGAYGLFEYRTDVLEGLRRFGGFVSRLRHKK